jgi:hypothetical protein
MVTVDQWDKATALHSEDDMANSRQRMVFECPDRLKKAIRMKAALEGLKAGEVILTALRGHLDRELEFVDQQSSLCPEDAPARRKVKKETELRSV